MPDIMAAWHDPENAENPIKALAIGPEGETPGLHPPRRDPAAQDKCTF